MSSAGAGAGVEAKSESAAASATAANAAAAGVIPCPPIFSRDEESTLRSALAFVVIRRRLEGRLALEAASAAAAQQEEEEEKKEGAADQNDGSSLIPPTIGGGGGRKRPRDVARTVTPGSAALSLLSGGLGGGGGTTATSTRTKADRSHISALVRLAISTALPICNGILVGNDSSSNNSSNYGDVAGNDDSGVQNFRSSPPLYDYQMAGAAAALVGGHGQHVADNVVDHAKSSKLAILDGLATNLAAQLDMVASVSTDAAINIIREDFLGVMLSSEVTTSNSAERAGEQEFVGNGGFCFFICEEEEGGLLDRTSLVAAICTVLHRIFFCSADGDAVSSVMTVAICSFLRHLCDGNAHASVNEGKGSTRGAETEEESDEGSDDDDADDDTDITKARVIEVPCVADTAAVNLLILLEEICLARFHDSPSSRSSILADMTKGFGAKLVISPLQFGTKDIAKFICDKQMADADAAAEEAMAGNGSASRPLLDGGAKLMLRLALWHLAGKLAPTC